MTVSADAGSSPASLSPHLSPELLAAIAASVAAGIEKGLASSPALTPAGQQTAAAPAAPVEVLPTTLEDKFDYLVETLCQAGNLHAAGVTALRKLKPFPDEVLKEHARQAKEREALAQGTAPGR